MARQLLISDDEEQYLGELLRANLKGLDIHDVMHGEPCAMSINTRRKIVSLMRKLELEVPDAGKPVDAEFPERLDEPMPRADLAAMAQQMQEAMRPALREFSPGRVERIAGAIFVRRMSDPQVRREVGPYVAAAEAIFHAQVFFKELEKALPDGI